MPPGDARQGKTSFPLKWLVTVGFVVVCGGLLAPQLSDMGARVRTPPDASEQPQTPDSSTPSAGPPTDALAKLLVAVGLIAAVCFGLTRYLGPRRMSAASGQLQIVASLPVDARCMVHLVRAGDRRLLVGVDWAGVKSVAELSSAFDPPTEGVVGPTRVTASATSADLSALLAAGGLHRSTNPDRLHPPSRPV